MVIGTRPAFTISNRCSIRKSEAAAVRRNGRLTLPLHIFTETTHILIHGRIAEVVNFPAGKVLDARQLLARAADNDGPGIVVEGIGKIHGIVRLAGRRQHGRDEVAVPLRQPGQEAVPAYRDEKQVNGETSGVKLLVQEVLEFLAKLVSGAMDLTPIEVESKLVRRDQNAQNPVLDNAVEIAAPLFVHELLL